MVDVVIDENGKVVSAKAAADQRPSGRRCTSRTESTLLANNTFRVSLSKYRA